LKQIPPANVDTLEIAWSYSVEDGGFYTFSPLVIDNIAYVSAKQGALVALDATTGKELWVHTFPGVDPAVSGANVPAVYEVNGRQYVLFALVGGSRFAPGAQMPPGGVNPPARSKSYVAMALPQEKR